MHIVSKQCLHFRASYSIDRRDSLFWLTCVCLPRHAWLSCQSPGFHDCLANFIRLAHTSRQSGGIQESSSGSLAWLGCCPTCIVLPSRLAQLSYQSSLPALFWHDAIGNMLPFRCTCTLIFDVCGSVLPRQICRLCLYEFMRPRFYNSVASTGNITAAGRGSHHASLLPGPFVCFEILIYV